MQKSKTPRGIYLIPIYNENKYRAVSSYEKILFQLLLERKPNECISHRQMPTYANHIKFVRSRPYAEWFMIQSVKTAEIVGAVYITHQNEIGIGILKQYRGKGYAKEAISKIIAQFHNRRLLANINPYNAASICLFRHFGFVHIQNTYEFAR